MLRKNAPLPEVAENSLPESLRHVMPAYSCPDDAVELAECAVITLAGLLPELGEDEDEYMARMPVTRLRQAGQGLILLLYLLKDNIRIGYGDLEFPTYDPEATGAPSLAELLQAGQQALAVRKTGKE